MHDLIEMPVMRKRANGLKEIRPELLAGVHGVRVFVRIQEVLVLALTVAILLTGIVLYFWLLELRGCQERCLEYYKINQTLYLINESGPFALPETSHQALKSIVFQQDSEISALMACQGRDQFNTSEWFYCNRIVRRPSA